MMVTVINQLVENAVKNKEPVAEQTMQFLEQL